MFERLLNLAEDCTQELSRRRVVTMLGELAMGVTAVLALGRTAAALPGRLCRSNDACGANEYCQKHPRACRSVGRCTPRPEACTQQYDPVCGCDGNTYSNACFAAMAGVNVAYPGECRQRRTT
jgi:hypothetical protein